MPMLPKLSPLPEAIGRFGGRPPLAMGWGIGEGDCEGSVIRGLSDFDGGKVEVCDEKGTALVEAGEDPGGPAIEPKLIFGRAFGVIGAPLGPVAPEAVMTTEGLRA